MKKSINLELNKTYEAISSGVPIRDKEKVQYYQEMALAIGASKAIFINPSKDAIFQEKVRLLCANNCARYGTNFSCPPHIPDLDYEKAIKEYNAGLIVTVQRDAKTQEQFKETRIESTNTLHNILLKLEKEAFGQGEYFATSFIGGSCKLCDSCYDECKHPTLSRIPIEATGMDVVKTLKNIGEHIEFPVAKYKKFSRTGLFLLSE